MYPEILARSFPEANVDLPENAGRWGVVSIGQPGFEPPMGFNPRNPLHLRLEFHDIVEEVMVGDKVFQPPVREDIEMLLDFGRMARGAPLVYCHCMAGISRSTAAAFILRTLWAGPGSEADALVDVYTDRPQAWPNEKMVALADDVLDRGGALMTALNAHDTSR